MGGLRFVKVELPGGWLVKLVAPNGLTVWRTVAGGHDGLYEREEDADRALELIRQAVAAGVEVERVEDGEG